MKLIEPLPPASRSTARLPLAISPRSMLVTLETLRIARGCDAETALASVADATHPHFLRWVFNLSVKTNDVRRRELRFWKEELFGAADKWCEPRAVVEKILGSRRTFPRGELEVQWTLNATTISRLVRAGELIETNHELTRASLAAFLERRLQ